MIDTEEQIEFDDVLKGIEVGVDISEGDYDILRYYRDEYKYYRDEYKDLHTEVKRLRGENKELEGFLNDLLAEIKVLNDVFERATKEIDLAHEWVRTRAGWKAYDNYDDFVYFTQQTEGPNTKEESE